MRLPSQGGKAASRIRATARSAQVRRALVADSLNRLTTFGVPDTETAVSRARLSRPRCSGDPTDRRELMVIPGIDPRVDIAFKKLFGTPAWSGLTISLIDAVLSPAPGRHLTELHLLNPYSEKDFLDDKITVLDIKARDERGRWFNVEMQMDLGRASAPRLLYYWARLYGGQLIAGEEYSELRPTISICFLAAG